MTNALTGDFAAVLQVSGGTIDRLMATLHQNAFTNPDLPSFPHSLQMRIGDSHPIDGVQGLAQVQIGVPRIDMIDGSTTRFGLEVGVRAWFRPDAGTAAFPAFINGTVGVQYELADIDPHCAGWSRRAANYLWIKVIQESVRFTGTADDDASRLDAMLPSVIAGLVTSPAATTAKIQRQIAVQLATNFAATPHPVSKGFQRGAMRTLNRAGGSALVTALPLNGNPSGNIGSVGSVLIGGADMAVAVSIDYVMSLINPALAPIASYSDTVSVSVSLSRWGPTIGTVYQVGVDPPTAQWLPGGGLATIRISVNGSATTKSILASATFSIVQDVVVSFDTGSRTLTLNPAGAKITATASGLGSDTVASEVKGAISKALPPLVQAACDQARPSLAAMSGKTQDLAQQLRTLDDKASVTLTSASFGADGMVLFGTVSLAPRAAPVVQVDKMSDAMSALRSWIPGGRIDKFEWSWAWGRPSSNPPGSAERADRFLLRRPSPQTGRWGAAIGLTTPLPGLDGVGSICLRIVGQRVDPTNGNLVPVQSTVHCTQYGINFGGVSREAGRLLLRDFNQAREGERIADLPLVNASATPATRAGANTLLMVLDERFDRATAETLDTGLQRCARFDAGLSLLVLFREGVLEAGRAAAAPIEEIARKLGIAVNINEDVHGDWSRALGRQHGNAWAIVDPEGRLAWTHQGALEAATLSSALDTHLRLSSAAAPRTYAAHRLVGSQLAAIALLPDLSALVDAHCPPPPTGLRGPGRTRIAFLMQGSPASVAELKRLARQAADATDGQTVVAIVDGAKAGDLETLKAEIGAEFVAIADHSGSVADRFGIDVWPTTLSVDNRGMVSDVAPGGQASH